MRRISSPSRPSSHQNIRLCCGSNSTVKSRPSDVFLDDSKTHAEYNRNQSGSLDSGYQALHYSLDSLDDRYQYRRGWNRTRIVLKYQDIHTETNERSKSETGFFKATLVYCPIVSEVQRKSLGLKSVVLDCCALSAIPSICWLRSLHPFCRNHLGNSKTG